MLLDRYLLPRFGALPLASIGHREVRAWVAELTAKGLAPATVHKCYQVLSKILAAAVEGSMIPRSPCRQIPLPKIERAEMRFLTVVEVRRLAVAVGPAYRALVLLAAYGGLRIGEIAGLRSKRLDLAAGVVEVAEVVTEMHGHLYLGPPKTTAGRRRVGLPKAAIQALQEHLAGRAMEPDNLVFAASNGSPIRTANFRTRVWRPATRAAGLEGLRIHDLRHTAVALWIAAGAGPKEVAARAGHTSVSFTLDRYGHLYPEADLALRDRLDRIHEAAGDDE
jgi:integrase